METPTGWYPSSTCEDTDILCIEPNLNSALVLGWKKALPGGSVKVGKPLTQSLTDATSALNFLLMFGGSREFLQKLELTTLLLFDKHADAY